MQNRFKKLVKIFSLQDPPGYYKGYCELCGRATEREDAVICPFCRRFVCPECTQTFVDEEGIERVLCKECYQKAGGKAQGGINLLERHSSLVVAGLLLLPTSLLGLSFWLELPSSLRVFGFAILVLIIIFLLCGEFYG